MKSEDNTQEKIEQLQLIEQNLQNFLMQKQGFQSQLLQIDNAMEELEKSHDKVTYKILGPLMIESNSDDVKNDLKSKKEVLDLRIKNIEKQENKLKEKAKKLQEEVMKKLNNKK